MPFVVLNRQVRVHGTSERACSKCKCNVPTNKWDKKHNNPTKKLCYTYGELKIGGRTKEWENRLPYVAPEYVELVCQRNRIKNLHSSSEGDRNPKKVHQHSVGNAHETLQA